MAKATRTSHEPVFLG